MPSFNLTFGLYGAQTLSGTEVGIVGQTATIATTDTPGVTGSGLGTGAIQLVVRGSIQSMNAISAIAFSGNNMQVIIGETADVTSVGGAYGVSIAGVNNITNFANAGSIVSSGSGFAHFGDAQALVFQNTGDISGMNYGILLDNYLTPNAGSATLNNAGTILGRLDGIFVAADGPTVQLLNSGRIVGTNNAIVLGTQGDSIRNTGQIEGDVLTGNGADTLDNRGGTIIGTVDLGDGVDTFILGGSAETANGGLGGQDWIDARSGSGGVIDLAEDRGTGLALGDVLTGFERVWGSASGADTIYGNASSNLLYGQGGNDSLDGDDGSDILYGGRGSDVLTGGAGSETFGFLSLAEIGDVITDFSSTGSGNDDRITIRAVSFGGGLVAGALNAAQFQSRADNVAQDSNDRFIFRTTDASLWFDVDGNGARGAVLVADLQAGATMTALDIILI